MKIEQRRWTEEQGWFPELGSKTNKDSQLVLLFGARQLLREQNFFNEIQRFYPKAHLFGCSTAGEIKDTQITDNSLVLTSVCFEWTHIQGASIQLSKSTNSLQAGELLAKSVKKEGLHISLFCLMGFT